MFSSELQVNYRAELVQADRNVLDCLLTEKRSPNTRRAYRKDIERFCRFIQPGGDTNGIINWFVSLNRNEAVTVTIKYKSHLIAKGLAEATVNRSLASLKSLVKMARKLGYCDHSLDDVGGEKVQRYRDTSGIDEQQYQQVVDRLNSLTPQGMRDYALLKLMWTNALRRGELVKINIGDLDADNGRLRIFGKGRGNQHEFVTLPPNTLAAILEWLKHHPHREPEQPMFCSLHESPLYRGRRLSTNAVYKITRKRCKKAGIEKVISPHRIRHSSITAALEKTDGNVRAVQKLSRHKNLDTLLIYDDNRRNLQGDVSNLLD